ncbi:MAG: hypothetical protein L6Q31_00845 [Fimbriimonadaceae bacterium]|nr:hypothetical protein [Fimbriimonadaceae bacterium]NUM38255.1 hypothetical protein [Armatimonadota bacterium]
MSKPTSYDLTRVAGDTALLAFVAGAGTAIVANLPLSRYDVPGWTLLLSPLAGASVVLAVLIRFISGLVPLKGSRFPSNLTLPVLHLAIVLVIVVLVTTKPTGIQRPAESFAVLEYWLRPASLLLVAGGEMAIMTAFAMVQARASRNQDAEESNL